MVRPNTIRLMYAMHPTHPAKVLGLIFTITAEVNISLLSVRKEKSIIWVKL